MALCILLSVTFTFLKCIITLSILRSTFNYIVVRPKAKIYLENFFVREFLVGFFLFCLVFCFFFSGRVAFKM